MSVAVTQENVHLLLPNIISRVTDLIALHCYISRLEALKRFYHSEVYAKLEDEQSKYWQLGSVALFEEFLECKDKH